MFEDFKNKHKNQTGVLICTGASLEKYKPIDAIHVGVNSAIFSGVDLDYHFIQDPGNKENPYSYVSKQAEYDNYQPNIAKFYGVSLSQRLKDRAKSAGAIPYHFSTNTIISCNGAKIEDPDQYPDWSSDLNSKIPAAAGSIAFPALQFMLHTGMSNIIIVGADILSSNRFNDEQNQNNYVAQNHLNRWKEFAKWVGRVFYDVRIEVINPIGLRNIFPEYSQKKYRMHWYCPPNTILDGSMPHCAFSAKIERLAPALAARGHDIYVYGHNKSTIGQAHLIDVMDDDTLAQAYGQEYVDGGYKTTLPKCVVGDHCHTTYTYRMTEKMKENARPNDFLISWYGHAAEEMAKQFDNLIVAEGSVGYFRTFAPFCCYETNFIRAYVDGLRKRKARWYDRVIPSIIDPNDFKCKYHKDDYLLFIGRLDQYKCPDIAIEAACRAGQKLIIAGQGEFNKKLPGNNEKRITVAGQGEFNKKLPGNVEYVGYADKKMRKELLSNARAVIIPSNFAEPNCFVAAEAAVSGTPVIASNHSGLVDNVINGKTGWLCSNLYEFTDAIHRIDEIDNRDCAKWGKNYHLSRAVEKYEKWFEQLEGINNGNDFYGRDLSASGIDLNSKILPRDLSASQIDLNSKTLP